MLLCIRNQQNLIKLRLAGPQQAPLDQRCFAAKSPPTQLVVHIFAIGNIKSDRYQLCARSLTVDSELSHFAQHDNSGECCCKINEKINLCGVGDFMVQVISSRSRVFIERKSNIKVWKFWESFSHKLRVITIIGR